jgi:hypothetical protein
VVENDRDLGCNGTFLVIRQLEQDVDGFRDYCKREAQRLQDRLPPPYDITDEFIAAKLIGRWRDGSSLTRYQYESRIEAARRKSAGERDRAGAHLPAGGDRGAGTRGTDPRSRWNSGAAHAAHRRQ